MKHLLALLLACLLLTGCARAEPAQTAPTAPPETTPVMEPVPLKGLPGDREDLRSYVLPMAVSDLRAMGDSLLLFTEEGLTLLTGEALTARFPLDFALSPEDPSLNIGETGLSFFDPVTQEVVVLDSALREQNRLAAPKDLMGAPILSGDGNTLFYCTASAIRAWDLGSGVRRMVKELPYAAHSLSALHSGDTILQAQVDDKAMLLSAQDGRLLWEGPKDFTMVEKDGMYYASVPTGMRETLYFGNGQTLTPRFLEKAQFLPRLHGAVTAGSGELSFYDLDTGLRSGILSLAADRVEGLGGYVYVLEGQTLHRWDVRATPSADSEIYTGPAVSLEACQIYADSIRERYGIQVRIGAEAAAAQPWDYIFTPETDGDATWRQLELLDDCLSNYPKPLLSDTAAPFDSLTVSLVRDIKGAPESGSVDTANGVQYLSDLHNNIALALGPQSRRTLYHELFHVMETRLLVESTAFDQWENLNPKNFRYDMSYTAPRRNDQFLQGEGRAFIDAYSMSYPTEDRARIMEYAMTPGNAELFEHEILQAKLNALCTGIRQAYGLKKSPETYLWEQYLDEPMAYQE